jgi:hypothetical protein
MKRRFDLLLDPYFRVFLVNCLINEDYTLLECGGVYVEPNVPFELIRLSDKKTPIMDIRLPDEIRNQPDPVKAWNTAFEIEAFLPQSDL